MPTLSKKAPAPPHAAHEMNQTKHTKLTSRKRVPPALESSAAEKMSRALELVPNFSSLTNCKAGGRAGGRREGGTREVSGRGRHMRLSAREGRRLSAPRAPALRKAHLCDGDEGAINSVDDDGNVPHVHDRSRLGGGHAQRRLGDRHDGRHRRRDEEHARARDRDVGGVALERVVCEHDHALEDHKAHLSKLWMRERAMHGGTRRRTWRVMSGTTVRCARGLSSEAAAEEKRARAPATGVASRGLRGGAVVGGGAGPVRSQR